MRALLLSFVVNRGIGSETNLASLALFVPNHLQKVLEIKREGIGNLINLI